MAPEVPPGQSETDLVVEVYEETHVLAWPHGTTLLSILKAHAINVPYACEEGDCGSCVTRVATGAVHMNCNQVLSADELDDGYILACQAIPNASSVRVIYD